MSKLTPAGVFPEKEKPLPVIGIGLEGITVALPLSLPLQVGVVGYIMYEKLIDVTVLPATENEIGSLCDVVPNQFP